MLSADQLSHFLTCLSAGGFAVPLVKVKEKYQVTIPVSVRQKAGLAAERRDRFDRHFVLSWLIAFLT